MAEYLVVIADPSTDSGHRTYNVEDVGLKIIRGESQEKFLVRIVDKNGREVLVGRDRIVRVEPIGGAKLPA